MARTFEIGPDVLPVGEELAQAGKQDTIATNTGTQTSFDHGSKSAIGTTAVQMTTTSVVAKKGVLVKAANANTGTVYVGNSDVTAGGTDATDGMELGAGEWTMVEVNNVNLIYLIASGVGQKVFFEFV